MNLVVWLVVFILASFFQFLVVPLHFGLLLVACLGLGDEDQASLWLVFLAGLINDLFLPISWGSSSLFFLWFVFGLKLLRQRLSLTAFLLAVLVFLAELVYSQIFFHQWLWINSFVLGLVSWFVFKLWPVKVVRNKNLELGLG